MMIGRLTLGTVLTFTAVMLLLCSGCSGTVKAAMAPEVFSGLDTIADGLFANLGGPGLNSIVDGLLDGLERTWYPEGSSSS